MVEPPILTSADDVHPHPAKTGHRVIDLIIAFSAISISVISLFVAVEHGKIQQHLVAANSWPFVAVHRFERNSVDNSRIFEVRIKNSGVGPAQVRSLGVRLDGRPVRNLSDLLSLCCGVKATDESTLVKLGVQTSSSPLGVLSAREELVVFEWMVRQTDPQLSPRLGSAIRNLKFRACYCSALDECWTSDLSVVSRPEKVEQCPVDLDQFSPSASLST